MRVVSSMTPSPLPRSRKITQETRGPEAFKGLIWVVILHQWAGVLTWGLVFAAALHGESVLSLWTVGVILALWLGNTWLMHKRRGLFVWMFLVQTFVEFWLLVFDAKKDSDIIGAGIGALILACYVVLSERSQNTFTRTMEEPTR